MVWRGEGREVPEHLVKIVNSSPSSSRPLQGLWKGICEDMTLGFFLVSYDDMGCIVCRRVDYSSKAPSREPSVFWTSATTFIKSPLSPEENLLYSTRLHLNPVPEIETDNGVEIVGSRDVEEVVRRMMYINLSYDLDETPANPRHFPGRIWCYTYGTFGFGFLGKDFIVDLKHVAQDGHLLNVIEEELIVGEMTWHSSETDKQTNW